MFWSSLAGLKPESEGEVGTRWDALEATGAFSRVAGLLFAFRSLLWWLHMMTELGECLGRLLLPLRSSRGGHGFCGTHLPTTVDGRSMPWLPSTYPKGLAHALFCRML